MLTDDHAEYLKKHAVSVELAEQLGVCSVSKASEIPEGMQAGLGKLVNEHGLGLLFPWTSHDGRVSPQLRLDHPRHNDDGEPIKYEFKRDSAPVLWLVRPNPRALKILLVEGSKQCLVAAELAPPEFEVYGVAGCWGWSHEKVPIPDLAVASGRDVRVVFDADAATNADVYGAAERLTKALKLEGAREVKWVRLDASGGSTGLDDLLASRADAASRAPYFARMIADAQTKVADRKPPRKAAPPPPRPDADLDRPVVDPQGDPLHVTNEIEHHLKRRYDATTLFCHGEVLSSLVDGSSMHPLTTHDFADLVVNTVEPLTLKNNKWVWEMYQERILGMIHSSRARNFTPLDRITNVPFVRQDGSICLEPGYDTLSKTYLVDSPDLEKVEVPENPDIEDMHAAVMLLHEWFCDMPFPDEASKTNALGLAMTYFIRGLVDVVPLAVISGRQASSGKNLLADCISIVALGRSLVPRAFTADDEENRKAVLAAFRAGEPAVCWDEAHELHGDNLSRLLTAPTYVDRILGVSNEAKFPNKMVFTALGNQVQLEGDIQRRVYPIYLQPNCPNPEDRADDQYLHPRLREWTWENRPQLLSAFLTLIRAWFQAERVPHVRADFGSFEDWQRIVGGILAYAGMNDFLTNRNEFRAQSNYAEQHWIQHMHWLAHTFGDESFTTREVRTQAQAAPQWFEGPPGLEDVSPPSFSRELGRAYGKRLGVWCDGLRMVKVGTAHAGANKYKILEIDNETPDDSPDLPDPQDPDGVSGDIGDTSTSYDPRKHILDTHARAHARIGESPGTTTTVDTTGELVFDLETGSADDLYSYEKGKYVRLGGYADATQPENVAITTDWADLTAKLREAQVVTGHNIMRFDLPALTHHGHDAPNIHELARDGKVFDTLLAARHLDPQKAKDKGVDAQRRHDLDSLGIRFFGDGAGKAGNLKALAKEFGGFDMIPIDDERYLTYLARDVTLNAMVYNRLQEQLDKKGAACRAYLVREHRVAAIAAQISLNGFRVDTDLLQERLNHNARVRSAALKRLHDRYDVPLGNSAGVPYKAPLATIAGKAALVKALQTAGLKEGQWWTTDKSDDIALSGQAMKYLYNEFHNIPAVRDIARMVITVVGLRSVYSTVEKFLVDGRVHSSISMHQATGRWSSTKPGLTVFGKRGGRYQEREIFLAEPGHVIIAVDLSQVDMRAIAGLSGDLAYVDMLRHEDPHAKIAELLFGDPGMREIAKPIGHGWNYGRGIKAISDSNDLDLQLVKKFDAQMRERFPRLVAWQGEVRAVAESGELLDNGWGRPMRPDPLRAFTQGPALAGQGGARDIMMEGLLRLTERYPEYLPYLRAQVHDEIVLSVPAADAEEIQRNVIYCMSFNWNAPSGVEVPILAEGGPVDRLNWGDVYRKGEK